jgi:hypothetical protein
MWNNKNNYPKDAGWYKVLVDWDELGEQREDWDYFTGHDWDWLGYRQFINKWRVPTSEELANFIPRATYGKTKL